MLHSIRKSVSKNEGAVPDLAFAEVRKRFDLYTEQVTTLKRDAQNFMGNAASVILQAQQVSIALGTLIDEPEGRQANAHKAVTTSVRVEHQLLQTDWVPKQNATMQTEIFKPIEAEIVRIAEFNARIKARMEMFTEMNYYQTKFNEIRGERDIRIAKGKNESPSDKEKFDRNQQKLNDSLGKFTESNTKLLADLNTLLNEERIKLFYPLLQQFVAQEQAFVRNYSNMLNTINMGSGAPGAAAEGASSNAAPVSPASQGSPMSFGEASPVAAE